MSSHLGKEKLRFMSHSTLKNLLHLFRKLNVMKSYNYEKKNGQILFKLDVKESFLTIAQNSDAIKEKIDKLDYIKYIKTVKKSGAKGN